MIRTCRMKVFCWLKSEYSSRKLAVCWFVQDCGVKNEFKELKSDLLEEKYIILNETNENLKKKIQNSSHFDVDTYRTFVTQILFLSMTNSRFDCVPQTNV